MDDEGPSWPTGTRMKWWSKTCTCTAATMPVFLARLSTASLLHRSMASPIKEVRWHGASSTVPLSNERGLSS